MDTPKEEITPDQLMEPFKGSSLKAIIIFTIVAHVVVLVATSIPYFLRSGSGDPAAGTEAERTETAVREATESIREIAEKHGLKPQDLGEQFAGGAPAAAAPAPVAPVEEETPETDEPKSAIEKELEVAEPGPELPSLGDENDDLFK